MMLYTKKIAALQTEVADLTAKLAATEARPPGDALAELQAKVGQGEEAAAKLRTENAVQARELVRLRSENATLRTRAESPAPARENPAPAAPATPREQPAASAPTPASSHDRLADAINRQVAADATRPSGNRVPPTGLLKAERREAALKRIEAAVAERGVHSTGVRG